MSVERRGSTALPAALHAGTGGTPTNSSTIAGEAMLEDEPGQQAHTTQFASQAPSSGQQSGAS
jgi:hypothetical protein